MLEITLVSTSHKKIMNTGLRVTRPPLTGRWRPSGVTDWSLWRCPAVASVPLAPRETSSYQSLRPKQPKMLRILVERIFKYNNTQHVIQGFYKRKVVRTRSYGLYCKGKF